MKADIKEGMEYTVVFRHTNDGLSFTVHDIEDTKKDRLAVARDLERGALSLKEGV